MKFNVEIEIPYDCFKFMGEIYEVGCAEYRDPEYKTLEEFKNSDVFKNWQRTDVDNVEKWFLSRNFGGTRYLIDDLLDLNLVEYDGDSWHQTFVLTELGKMVWFQNNSHV